MGLMNPGKKIPKFIEKYTGITNEMIATAEPNETVMREFHEFIGNYNLVAHSASFDKKFLDAEFKRIGLESNNNVGCSLLTSRRMYQDSPKHKLGVLVKHLKLSGKGTFH